jgi:hypothetical protein
MTKARQLSRATIKRMSAKRTMEMTMKKSPGERFN